MHFHSFNNLMFATVIVYLWQWCEKFNTAEHHMQNIVSLVIVKVYMGSSILNRLPAKICLELYGFQTRKFASKQAWNFFLDKNRITNKTFICCILLVSGIQLLFAFPENQVQIWLVILGFFFKAKFHARQILVLSSPMKMGPDGNFLTISLLHNNIFGSRYKVWKTFCCHRAAWLDRVLAN